MPLSPADRSREALHARQVLANLKHHEDLVRWAESSPCLVTRHHCAQRYRSLFDVPHRGHAALRHALERVRDTKCLSVDDAVAWVRQQLDENGLP